MPLGLLACIMSVMENQVWLTLGVLALLFILWLGWTMFMPVRPVDPPLHLEGEARSMFQSVSEQPPRDDHSWRLFLVGLFTLLLLAALIVLLWPYAAAFWLAGAGP
jgi:hypothetical protein